MSKAEKSDRRAVIDQMRSQQKSQERRRSLLIVGLCVLVALLIIGIGAYQPIKGWLDRRQLEGLALSDLGEPATVCGDIITKKATGNQDHVQPGTPIDYPDSPPAFGTHYDIWESMDRKLYTTKDRPEVGKLVHNLEHGFTILWYDETVADDGEQMAVITSIAQKFSGTDNQRLKFKAAPWLESDGEPFPDGQHVAFTHWSVGGVGEDAKDKQQGVWQYCSAPSGEALESFMTEYPYMDSPEPNAV